MLRWINMHSRRLMTLGDRRTWNNLNILSTWITEPRWTRRAYLVVCLGGKIHIFYLPYSSLFSNGSVAFVSPDFIFTRHNKAASPPLHLPILNNTPPCIAWLSSWEVPLSCCCVVKTIRTQPGWAEGAELTPRTAAVAHRAHSWHYWCHPWAPVCSMRLQSQLWVVWRHHAACAGQKEGELP